MKISDELKLKAHRVMHAHELDKIYVNEKEEFFTSKALAANSVNGKEDDYERIKKSKTYIDKVEALIKEEKEAEEKARQEKENAQNDNDNTQNDK